MVQIGMFFKSGGHPYFGILSSSILLHDKMHRELKEWKNIYGKIGGGVPLTALLGLINDYCSTSEKHYGGTYCMGLDTSVNFVLRCMVISQIIYKYK